MAWHPSRRNIGRLNKREPVRLVTKQEARLDPALEEDAYLDREESVSIAKPPPRKSRALYGMTCHDNKSDNQYTQTMVKTERAWREATGQAWNTPVHKRSK